MKFNIINSLILMMILISSPIKAYEFSYTYLQFSSGTASDNSVSPEISSDVTSLAASYNIYDNTALTLGYSKVKLNDFDAETYALDFGITAHSEINESTDYFINISGVDAVIKTGPSKTSDAGFSVTGGLRHAGGDKVELNIAISHSQAFSVTTNGIAVGIRYNLSNIASIGANYLKSEDIDSVLGDIRIGF